MKFRPALIPILAVLVFQSITLGQTLPPAIQWVPQDAVISLEISNPKALLDFLAGDKMTKAITALPLYQKQMSNPKFQEFLNVIKFMETALDTNWRTALAKLTGGGITFVVCPQETVLLIIDAEDEQMLNQFHEMLLNISRSEAEKKSQPGLVTSMKYQDVTAWTFNSKEQHAIIGKRFVFSNRPEGLKTILELRSKDKSASLASKSGYQAAIRQAKADTIATAYVDLNLFKQIPDINKLLDQSGKNPLAALFFAGIVESMRDANWLALSLNIHDSKLALQASIDDRTAPRTSPAAFALPQAPIEGVLPNVSVPRCIAAMTMYRDLHKFYAAKDELFPERTSGLIFFENMMGIFFSGRDLTNEVLAETRPEIRFIVAEQQFDPSIGTPIIQYPAFAMILRLRHPEEFKEVAEEAWQKAIGLVNFTRGQQAMPGLIIDRPVYGDTKLTVSYFSTSEVENKAKLDQRFNVRPTLAIVDENLVLSSTDALAKDLVDTLGREKKGGSKPLAQVHSMVEIDGSQLASIAWVNRQVLIRNNMVEKGNTQEQAEAGIDMLISLARFIKHLKLSIGMHKSLTQANLELDLNL